MVALPTIDPIKLHGVLVFVNECHFHVHLSPNPTFHVLAIVRGKGCEFCQWFALVDKHKEGLARGTDFLPDGT